MAAQSPDRFNAGACFLFGAGLWLVGLYFLVLEPGVTFADGSSTSVANARRLAMGQTFFLSGSVFLAVALRPRV